jgi:hypothetical protein
MFMRPRPLEIPGSVSRDEQLAVGALEAPVALRLTGHQFSRERLLAMWADDLVLRLRANLGHGAKVPCGLASRAGTAAAPLVTPV